MKLNHYSLLFKYETVKAVSSNQKTRKEICVKYRIKKSTMHGWLKNKEKIIHEYEKNSRPAGAIKFKTSRFPQVDQALLDWFIEQRALNTLISTDILHNKANEISESFNLKDFECNRSWLGRFKKRYNIIWSTSENTYNKMERVIDSSGNFCEFATNTQEDEDYADNSHESVDESMLDVKEKVARDGHNPSLEDAYALDQDFLFEESLPTHSEEQNMHSTMEQNVQNFQNEHLDLPTRFTLDNSIANIRLYFQSRSAYTADIINALYKIESAAITCDDGAI